MGGWVGLGGMVGWGVGVGWGGEGARIQPRRAETAPRQGAAGSVRGGEARGREARGAEDVAESGETAPLPLPGRGGWQEAHSPHGPRLARDSAPSGFFLPSGKREERVRDVFGSWRSARASPGLGGHACGARAQPDFGYSLGGPHAHSACGPRVHRVIAPARGGRPSWRGGDDTVIVTASTRARLSTRARDRDGVGPRGTEAVGSSLPATYYAVSSTWLVRCAARAAGAPCAQGGHGNYAH